MNIWNHLANQVIRNPGFEILDPRSGVRAPGYEILDPRSWIRDPKFEIRVIKTRIQYPGSASKIRNTVITEMIYSDNKKIAW
jgi:hypothetical protein